MDGVGVEGGFFFIGFIVIFLEEIIYSVKHLLYYICFFKGFPNNAQLIDLLTEWLIMVKSILDDRSSCWIPLWKKSVMRWKSIYMPV